MRSLDLQQETWKLLKEVQETQAAHTMQMLLQPHGVHFVLVENRVWFHSSCYLKQLEEIEKILKGGNNDLRTDREET